MNTLFNLDLKRALAGGSVLCVYNAGSDQVPTCAVSLVTDQQGPPVKNLVGPAPDLCTAQVSPGDGNLITGQVSKNEDAHGDA